MKKRHISIIPLKILVIILFLFIGSLSSKAYLPDSTRYKLEDFDTLTSTIEKNLAHYPYIMPIYAKEYSKMKKTVRRQILQGKDMESAACDYMFWFYSKFDGHCYVQSHKFWSQYDSKLHTKYTELMDYDPQPVAQAVDVQTFLVRVPSCVGKNPSFAWVDSAAVAFENSKCPYLILDVRGNTGGSDAIWQPFFKLLMDKRPENPWRVIFRKTPRNMRIFGDNPQDSIGAQMRQRVENYKGAFVPLTGDDEDDFSFEPMTSNLKKCAVIIDNRTASSAETIVRFAKDCCSRAKIYGRDNTSGAQLSGNILTVQLPHSHVNCDYPTCIDTDFIKQIQTKQRGIAPDVRLDIPLPSSLKANVDSWVLWVAKDLEK